MAQHINRFNDGMKGGIDNTVFPQSGYSYMLNGHIVSRDERGFSIVNVKGTEHEFNLGLNRYIIGCCEFNSILYMIVLNEDERTVELWMGDKHSDGEKWIDGFGRVPNMINSGGDRTFFSFHKSIFGWTKNKLLEVIAKSSYDGSLDLYICDGLNPNIIINTGVDNNGIIATKTYDVKLGESQFVQKLKINSVPTVRGRIIDNASQGLLPGAYWFYISYMDQDLNRTFYVKEYGPVYISGGDYGIRSDIASSKNIILTIENLDISYPFIKVSFVRYFGDNGVSSHSINMLLEGYRVSSFVEVVINNAPNSYQPIMLEELKSSGIAQAISETQTQLDGVWFGGNWKTSTPLSINATLTALSLSIIPVSTGNSATAEDILLKMNNSVENLFMNIYELTEDEKWDFMYMMIAFETQNYFKEQINIALQQTTTKQQVFLIINAYQYYTSPFLPFFDVLVYSREELEDLSDEELFQICNIYSVQYDASDFNRVDAIDRILNEQEQNPKSSWQDVPSLIISLTEYANEAIATTAAIYFDRKIDREYNDGIEQRFGYMEEEVYPLGVYYIIDGQYKTDVFPVRGWHCTAENVIPNIGLITGSTTIEALNNRLNALEWSNQKGLFCTANRNTATNSFFDLVGIRFNMQAFYKHFNMLNAPDRPNITQIYFVQGNRIKNTICQGFCSAGVKTLGFEAVGIHTGYGNTKFEQRWVNQTMNLGTNSQPRVFPWIDFGNNYQMFPVLRAEMFRSGSGGTLAFFNADMITEIPVQNGASEYHGFDGKDAASDDSHRYFRNRTDTEYNMHVNRYLPTADKVSTWNVTSNNFCIFSPDIMMSNIEIRDEELYIVPIKKFQLYPRNIVQSGDSGWSPPNVSPRSPLSAFNGGMVKERGRTYSYGNIDVIHNRKFNDPTNSGYLNPHNNEGIKAMSNIVVSKSYGSTELPYASKMNNMINTYGKDFSHGLGSGSVHPAWAQLRSKTMSRNSLLKEGYLLNMLTHFISEDSAQWTGWTIAQGVSGDKGYCCFIGEFNNLYAIARSGDNVYPLHAPCINLAMSSLPYIGCTLDGGGREYLNIRAGLPLSQRADQIHNAIVNLNRYETMSSYLESALNNTILLTIRYSDISNCGFDIDVPFTDIILKGDLFSQKTYMRPIHYDELIDGEYLRRSVPYKDAFKPGFLLGIYLQSTVNTRLRCVEENKTFYQAYAGANRDSASKREFAWGNELLMEESWLYNDGYNAILNPIVTNVANDEYVNTRIAGNSPNKIRFSTKHESGSLIDAYKELLEENEEDFAIENGEIIKLITFNNTLLSIQTDGINRHYQGSQLEPSDGSANIILGDKASLSEQYQMLADYGTQHKESIVLGDNGAYGVDWKRGILWRIVATPTMTGSMSFGVEDLADKKQLYHLFKWLKGKIANDNLFEYKENLPQDVYKEYRTSKTPLGIVSGFDKESKNVLFTFHLPLRRSQDITNSQTHTLVYNELLDIFVGWISYAPNLYLPLDNKMYYTTSRTQAGGANSVWKIDNNISNSKANLQIEGDSVSFELEFIINCRSEENNAGEFEKEFQSHLINSCAEEFTNIRWITESQDSDKLSFMVGEEEFWNKPEYREHDWRLPVRHNNINNQVGKGDGNEFDANNFKETSRMRGQWLKVKLTYSGTNYLYIRNVITNFIISYYN